MIPTNYKDIKLEQLAGVHKILKSDDDHVDKCIRLLSYLTNKSRRYYESLPLWKLQHHFKQISFLFQPNPKLPVKKVIWLNGYPYKALLDVSKFSSSRYLSLKHYVSNGQTEQNLHKIIALMYKPLFKSDKLDEEGNYKDDSMNEINRRADLIKGKSCYDVYGAVFFLFQSVHNLERPYADLFGTSDGEDKPPHERTKSKLITHYGWYHILNIVTDNDPFKEEELMKWNVRRLLNRLMYLKDKASIEAWEAELGKHK